MTLPLKLLIHIDGGSRGNPGPAGAGVLMEDAVSDKVVHRAGYFLGAMTNNLAEYRGLVQAVTLASELGPAQVDIRSDSQLMVKQIQGAYRVKSADLKPLHVEAIKRLDALKQWSLTHVPREQNEEADRLANLALDAGRDVILVEKGVKAGGGAGSQADGQADPGANPQLPCWTATLRGRPGRCLAGTAPGNQYTLGPTTPDGLCVHAAAAALARGPLDWPDHQRTGQARCQACGLTVALERLA